MYYGEGIFYNNFTEVNSGNASNRIYKSRKIIFKDFIIYYINELNLFTKLKTMS
jgi:hypothetical protein